jgi:hypothetical protein
MKTIKSFNQAIRIAGNHQITAQELLNNKIYSHKDGWIDIKLSKEFRNDMCEDITNLLGGYSETKKRVKFTLMYEKPQHWGLTRMVIATYKNKSRWIYIVGQDQSYENKIIREYLKK